VAAVYIEAKSYCILIFRYRVDFPVSLAMAMLTVCYQVSNLPALDYRHSEVGDKASESVRTSNFIYRDCSISFCNCTLNLGFINEN